MLKTFLITCIFFFAVKVLPAQDEPTRSIGELNTLLQKNNSDSASVSLLLEAALSYILKPGAERIDMDSALYFTTNAMNISNKLNDPVLHARCFRVYSQLYRESNQKDKGLNYINQAISIFAKYDQKESLGDSYIELHRYYDIFSDSEWTLTVRYAEQAEQLYKKSRNKIKQANTLKQIGDIYQLKDKDSLALQKLYEALAIYNEIRYQEVQGVYDLMGLILSKQGNFNQALKYGLLAAETAEKLKTDSRELGTIYNRIGLICYRLTKYPEANEYFTKSFSVATQNKDTNSIMMISLNRINTYFRLGKQQELIYFLQQVQPVFDKGDKGYRLDHTSANARAHLLTGNVKEAGAFVKQLLLLAGNATDLYTLRQVCIAVIPFYFETGQYAEMYKYLPDNERYCRTYKSTTGLADNYLWWFKADSALGNNTAAIAHYKLYKEASDSSLRLTASRQINELLVEYESYKKDQAIAANEANIQLLTQQDLLQKSKLQRGSIIRNIYIVLVAFLIIIMVLLYGRYRLKQRTNKKLQLQQEEISKKNQSLQHLVNEKEWLLKEIHHRVKNNLQIVMSLLNSQSVYINNDAALSAIHDSQHRVHAMSLIHQKLYGAENVSSIDLSLYIREMVTYLADSFSTGQRIRFEYAIEPLEMDVSQAVPLGLILNEAITNSIKYAFPENRNGTISISLSNTSRGLYLLCISDNGIGVPSDLRKSDSLGMSLMKGLSEDIDGTLSIENNNGTTIKVSFMYDPGVKNRDSLAPLFASNN